MSEFTDRQAAVERFLYQEARLLDDGNFAQWVDLFTEDGLYWVPSGQDGPAEQAVALIYDNTHRLRERLTRMGSRAFWAQQPPTHTTRLVGNVLVEPSDGPGQHLYWVVFYKAFQRKFGLVTDFTMRI